MSAYFLLRSGHKIPVPEWIVKLIIARQLRREEKRHASEDD